jgi:adenosylcobyric acid synthase
MAIQDKTPRPSARLAGLEAVPHGGVDWAELTRFKVSHLGIIDLSANINPYGAPPSVQDALKQVRLDYYPDAYSTQLRETIANQLSLMPDSIVVGNGSVELIYALAHAYIDPGQKALVVGPTFGEYAHAVRVQGGEVIEYTTRAANGFQPDIVEILQLIKEHAPRLVFVCNPNNPTGTRLSEREIQTLMDAATDEGGMLVVDEAYMSLADALPDGEEYNPTDFLLSGGLVLLRSLTKEFALPGLRLGYAIVPHPVARVLHISRPPWSVNAFAQQIGRVLLSEQDWRAQTRSQLGRDKAYLLESLAKANIETVPGAANFVLIKVGEEGEARDCRTHLLRQQIIVRDCSSFGLPDYIRVAVAPPDATDRFVEEYKGWLATKKPRPAAPNLLTGRSAKNARTIMLQGTAGGVGKSMLAAGLGRVLAQDGLSVAPFVAQNIAPTGYGTRDGGLIGAEQASLAGVFGVEPSAHMNPILLKPEGDNQCQVVVRGKVKTNLSPAEFYAHRDEMLAVVQDSLNQLRQEHDFIIIEGAGNPADFALRESDIVNMPVARLANSPVLLVADAERGGAIPALVGTLELLEPEERALVKGLLVNKFRGDPTSSAQSAAFLEKRTGHSVLGVLPFADDLDLHKLPNVAPNSADRQIEALDRDGVQRDLDICVVLLPHIANFEDFDALELETGVEVRYVRELFELGSPDLVVLPGTSTSIADLQFLEESGIGQAITKLAESGTPVLGICGGYQMLGERIDDPERVESRAGGVAGLGLLPVRSIYAYERGATKVTGRIEAGRGVFQGLPGITITAQEVSMGRTEPTHYSFSGPTNDNGYGVGGDARFDHVLRLIRRDDAAIDTPDGFINEQGNVWGTYLQGLFKNDQFRHAVLANLLKRKGISGSALQNRRLHTLTRDREYDRVADLLRQNVRMDVLRQLAGL